CRPCTSRPASPRTSISRWWTGSIFRDRDRARRSIGEPARAGRGNSVPFRLEESQAFVCSIQCVRRTALELEDLRKGEQRFAAKIVPVGLPKDVDRLTRQRLRTRIA